MRETTSEGHNECTGEPEYRRGGGTCHQWSRAAVAGGLALALGTAAPVGAEDVGPDTGAGLAAYAMTAPSMSAPDLAFRESIDLAVGGEPNLRSELTPPLISTVRLAFPIAMRRALSNPTCTRLFEVLDADPAAVLARTLYYPARGSAAPACKAGADAFTIVGSPVTYLCPSFAGLSRERAAFVIIHEALHFAGLRERPIDPQAHTAFQINKMVREGCRRQNDRVTEDAGVDTRDDQRRRGSDRS